MLSVGFFNELREPGFEVQAVVEHQVGGVCLLQVGGGGLVLVNLCAGLVRDSTFRSSPATLRAMSASTVKVVSTVFLPLLLLAPSVVLEVLPQPVSTSSRVSARAAQSAWTRRRALLPAGGESVHEASFIGSHGFEYVVDVWDLPRRDARDTVVSAQAS